VKRELLNAWRQRYENDPEVTQRMIGDDVGLSQEYVGSIIRADKWCRPYQVTVDARLIGQHKAHTAMARSIPQLDPLDRPSATPSIWAAAAGITVTTGRPHVVKS
jgi:hypothetical protein